MHVPIADSRVFQSTHPTRGCDGVRSGGRIRHRDFNPRTPRGGATAIYCRLLSRATTCCRPNITSLFDVVRFLNNCTNLLLFSRRTSQAFSHSFRFADVITLLNRLTDHSWFLLHTLRFYCYIFSRDSIFADYLPLH